MICIAIRTYIAAKIFEIVSCSEDGTCRCDTFHITRLSLEYFSFTLCSCNIAYSSDQQNKPVLYAPFHSVSIVIACTKSSITLLIPDVKAFDIL
jgi:hypothetical protein